MTQDNESADFLLVDAEIAFGVQYALVEAGLAKLKGDHFFDKERIRRGRRRFQQALDFLLLYDRLLIPERILDVTLTHEANEYVQVIPDDTDYWKDPVWLKWGVEHLNEILKEPATAPRNEHYEAIPLESAVLKAFRGADIQRLLEIQGMLLPYLRTKPSTFDSVVRKDVFEIVLGLLTGDPFCNALWRVIGSHPERDAMAWWIKCAAARVFEELKMVDWLLTKSAQLRVPLATPRVRAIAARKLVMNTSDDYVRAFQIYLEEVATFPLLRSIADVEGLRSRREIKRFRVSLREWTTAIQAGDPTAEQRLRKEIQSANEALRYLGRMRTTGWWTTALSLPIGVAELLLGSPGVGGLALAAIGSVTLLKTKKARNAASWMILGN